MGAALELLLELLEVDVGALDELEEPPTVALGSPSWAYPKRPSSVLPHLSLGYPGQLWEQDPTLVVDPGASFEHQQFSPCKIAKA